VLGGGRRARVGPVDFVWVDGKEPFSRVGVIVPKHRHNSVERNLLRRRLKELSRRVLLPELSEIGLEVDVLVRARREAYDASFVDLERAVARFLEVLWSARSSSG
jgi:ribonuclease P protein component